MNNSFSPSRRVFIKMATAAGGAVGLGFRAKVFAAGAEMPNESPKPMRILILGGTGFIGPHQVRYAVSRGHKVTVFNRGKTNRGELPEAVEQLVGDRNGQLDALKGREWDVVIDNPAMLPSWVRDAAEILHGNVEQYVFISTLSVYADVSKPGVDEDGVLERYSGADAMKETMESLRASQFKLYGPLKVLAEQETEKWFPGKTLIIRPGLIVGPGDETDRFTYWPVRIARGGEVLAPAEPADPVQFIDVRDLAEWTVRMVERRATGTFNATGPQSSLPIGDMMNGIKKALQADANFTWVPADFLEKQKVAPWSDMPVWLPPRGETAGFARIDVRRAVAAGLTFRPLEFTARDTLAWFKSLPAERQAKLKAGLTPEREAAVLAAWHKDHR